MRNRELCPGFTSNESASIPAAGCRAVTGVLRPVRDTGFFGVVGAHLHFHRIARGDLDEMLAKLPRDVREHDVPVGELNPEHCSRQHRNNSPIDFDVRSSLQCARVC